MTTQTEIPVPPAAPVDAGKLWREAVEAELKGVPFEKKLVTRTFEGIALQPLYFSSDAAGVGHLGVLPGSGSLVRGAREAAAHGKTWEFCQNFPAETPAQFNARLTTALAGGLNAVTLEAARVSIDSNVTKSAAPGGMALADTAAFAAALKNVVLTAVPVHLNAGASPLPLAALYLSHTKASGATWEKLQGSVTADPLAEWATRGELPVPLETLYDDLAGWTSQATVQARNLATIGVSGEHWLEAGGNAVQELAFAVAAGVEYLRALQNRDVPCEVAASRMRFAFAVGGQFFTEVAKFRAFRLVWSRVLKAFALEPAKAWPRVHARTANWDKSALDPHVNLLRATTEALSAVLGGVDSLSIGTFDEVSGTTSDVSLRIARNLHTLLAEEFRLAAPADPAGGSWYIEKITDELARKAWELFQDVEKRGGYARAFESGMIQKVVAVSAAEKADAVSKRRLALVGVNLFPNLKESRLEPAAASPAQTLVQDARKAMTLPTKWPARLEAAVVAADCGENASRLARAAYPESGRFSPATKVETRRAAEGFEALRAAADAYLARTGTRPKVFLAKMGPVKQHKPRADFAAGFFAVGGFEAMAKQSFDTPENAALAAVQSGAPIAVLCSTDETYPELAPAFAKAAKAVNPALILVLAGYPSELVASLRSAGFDEFIHVRSDVRSTLENFLNRIGALPSKS
jgi:methylmalonyl-CoA mutase